MYKPKPGDLIFSWICATEHNDEVMIFIGESVTEWHACNFYDKRITYTFTKKGYYNKNLLAHYCRFDINRLSKRAKHRYKIGQTVSINGYSNRLFFPPIIAEIVHLKLKYNSIKKKCYTAYKFKIINEKQIDPNRLIITANYEIYLAKEKDIMAYTNYNKIWDDLNV